MADIVFIFEGNIDGRDLRLKPMGGISTSVIMLAEAFARLGHSVTIYNNREAHDGYEGVYYRPHSAVLRIEADLVIANNSAKPLMRVRKGIPVVWQHNRTKLSRIWKRGEFLGLILKRPHLVCLSNDARQQTPKWIPYRSLQVIPHAIEPMFLQADVPRFAERRQRVFFASRASRNLKWVIEVWKQYIHPVLPDAEFVVCVPPSSPFPFDAEALATHNILYKGSLPKDELAGLINTCKALVYPGHINETGCQVALQAIGLGVPIVSCGHGSLKDLVQHDVTGFIEMDMQAYAARVIQCLTDEDVWCRLHRASLQHPWRKSYDERALDWQKTFLQQ
jgi:glycosyltransferase involved in cell wall biosynthesis